MLTNSHGRGTANRQKALGVGKEQVGNTIGKAHGKECNGRVAEIGPHVTRSVTQDGAEGMKDGSYRFANIDLATFTARHRHPAHSALSKQFLYQSQTDK